MTDLEMTKLCAEAMGWRQHTVSDKVLYNEEALDSMSKAAWDPLHDDAQAMALVKKCGLSISGPTARDKDREFYVLCVYEAKKDGGLAQSRDLNRAIVECVAKMQACK